MTSKDVSLLYGIIPFVVILLIWQLVSGNLVSAVYLPPASAIIESLVTAFTHSNHVYAIPSNLLLTLERTVAGFLIAAAIGIPTGIGIGLSKRISRLLEPTVEVFRVLPGVVLIPVFILLIGINNSMYVGFVAFGAIWPILINTVDGVKGIEPMFFDVGKSFKIRGFNNFRKVTLPGASPYIFSGMRVSLLIALLIDVAAEIVVGHNGLGFSIYTAMQFANVTLLYAEIYLIGVVGFLMNVVFILFENRFMTWHKSLQLIGE